MLSMVDRRVLVEVVVADFQHKVVGIALRQSQDLVQGAVWPGSRLRGTGPAQPQSAGAGGPDPVVTVGLPQRPPTESAPRVQGDADRCVPVERFDAAQQHDAVRVAGERESLLALDDAAGGDPSARPDQCLVLVEAAPHKPAVDGRDGVAAATAE
jgi:hypothetical protein